MKNYARCIYVVVVKKSIRYPVPGRLAALAGLDGFSRCSLTTGYFARAGTIQYTQHLKYAALAIVGEGK